MPVILALWRWRQVDQMFKRSSKSSSITLILRPASATSLPKQTTLKNSNETQCDVIRQSGCNDDEVALVLWWHPQRLYLLLESKTPESSPPHCFSYNLQPPHQKILLHIKKKCAESTYYSPFCKLACLLPVLLQYGFSTPHGTKIVQSKIVLSLELHNFSESFMCWVC